MKNLYWSALGMLEISQLIKALLSVGNKLFNLCCKKKKSFCVANRNELFPSYNCCLVWIKFQEFNELS